MQPYIRSKSLKDLIPTTGNFHELYPTLTNKQQQFILHRLGDNLKPDTQICKETGISHNTIHAWKSQSVAFRTAYHLCPTLVLDAVLTKAIGDSLGPIAISETSKLIRKDWETLSHSQTAAKEKQIGRVLERAWSIPRPVATRQAFNFGTIIMQLAKGEQVIEGEAREID